MDLTIKCTVAMFLLLFTFSLQEPADAKSLLETLFDYEDPLNLNEEKSQRVAREWAKTGNVGTKGSKQKFFQYEDDEDDYKDSNENFNDQQTLNEQAYIGQQNANYEDKGQEHIDQQHIGYEDSDQEYIDQQQNAGYVDKGQEHIDQHHIGYEDNDQEYIDQQQNAGYVDKGQEHINQQHIGYEDSDQEYIDQLQNAGYIDKGQEHLNEQEYIEYEDNGQEHLNERQHIEYEDNGQEHLNEQQLIGYGKEYTSQKPHVAYEPSTKVVPAVNQVKPTAATTTECPDDVPTYRIYGILRCGQPIYDEPDALEIINGQESNDEDDQSSQIGQSGYWASQNENFHQPGIPVGQQTSSHGGSQNVQFLQPGIPVGQQTSSHGGTHKEENNGGQGYVEVPMDEDYKEYSYENGQQELTSGETGVYQQHIGTGQAGSIYDQQTHGNIGSQQHVGRSDEVEDIYQQHVGTGQAGNIYQQTNTHTGKSEENPRNAWPSLDIYGQFHRPQQLYDPSDLGPAEPDEVVYQDYGQQQIHGDFSCFQKAEGYYPDYKSDCRKFYRCAPGHFDAYVFECGPGTKFDEINLLCDFADNITCGRGRGQISG